MSIAADFAGLTAAAVRRLLASAPQIAGGKALFRGSREPDGVRLMAMIAYDMLGADTSAARSNATATAARLKRIRPA